MNRGEAGWPYCETVEALEARDRRRTWVREVAGVVVTLATVFATWQALNIIAVATYATA